VAWRDRDRELARLVPLEQIVVETDGPYPHERVFAGMRTESWMVSAAIEEVAEVKGKSREEIEMATGANARRLLALKAVETTPT
jgi:TatD DNase family protein